MKHTFSLLFAILVAPLAAADAANTPAAAPSQPNILFIMADDHTTQAFGVYGSRLAKLNPTPNIDALAEAGLFSDQAWIGKETW